MDLSCIRMQLFLLGVVLVLMTGCAFNFELTSQRTALENQIMGTYKELDDDVVLVAKVKDIDAEEKPTESKAALLKQDTTAAQQNREFNKDDIDDLKSAQILGEAKDGKLVILPDAVGMVVQAKAAQLKLAKLLTVEENRDRELVWKRQSVEADDPSNQNIDEIKQEFVKNTRLAASPGHWVQNSDGTWEQKSGSK